MVHISIARERLADFCLRWRIIELALFGSVLREDFGPESDVDVLVVFAPDANWRYEHFLEMKEELEAIWGRKVDLVDKRWVEQSENYIRRKHILTNLEPVYVAG